MSDAIYFLLVFLDLFKFSGKSLKHFFLLYFLLLMRSKRFGDFFNGYTPGLRIADSVQKFNYLAFKFLIFKLAFGFKDLMQELKI